MSSMLRSIMPTICVLGRVGLTRRIVVAELVDVDCAGLIGDLFEHIAGEDLGAEDRRHVLVLNLLDQLGDIPGGRLREIRRLDGTDDGHAVMSREISIRVVVGHQLAIGLGNRLDRRHDPGIERGKEFGVAAEVLRVVVGVGGVAFRQPASRRIRHIAGRTGR